MGLKKDKRQDQSFLSWFCCQRRKKYPYSLLGCCPGEQDRHIRDGAEQEMFTAWAAPCPTHTQACPLSFVRLHSQGSRVPSLLRKRPCRDKHFGMFGKACPEACQFLTLCSLAFLHFQRESPVRNIWSSRSCFVRKNMEALFQVLFLPLSLSQVHWRDINLISKLIPYSFVTVKRKKREANLTTMWGTIISITTSCLNEVYSFKDICNFTCICS